MVVVSGARRLLGDAPGMNTPGTLTPAVRRRRPVRSYRSQASVGCSGDRVPPQRGRSDVDPSSPGRLPRPQVISDGPGGGGAGSGQSGARGAGGGGAGLAPGQPVEPASPS